MVDAWEPDHLLEPVARERLSRELDALSREFPGVSRGLLERLTGEAMHELAEVRVETFVPLLVHRRVRQRLLSLPRQGAAAGNDIPAPP